VAVSSLPRGGVLVTVKVKLVRVPVTSVNPDTALVWRGVPGAPELKLMVVPGVEVRALNLKVAKSARVVTPAPVLGFFPPATSIFPAPLSTLFWRLCQSAPIKMGPRVTLVVGLPVASILAASWGQN
jgi:hypothetical protein